MDEIEEYIEKDQYSSSVDIFGNKRFFKNGFYHRDGGPAMISDTGVEYWYHEGLLHRDNAPAVTSKNSLLQEYWQHGLLHRVDGPASIDEDGNKYWYQNDKLHRLDGPAAEYIDGTFEFYFHGKQVFVSSTKEYLRYLNLKVFL